MIKKIKRNLNLLKYGYHFEINILGAVICIIAGLMQLIFMNSLTFVLLSGVFIINLSCTLEISGVIKSSPKFRSFYFGIQRIVNVMVCVLYFTMLFIVTFIQTGSFEKLKLVIGNELVVSGVFYIIILFYMSIAYKLFFISTLIFFTGYLAWSVIYAFFGESFNFTMQQGMLIALICVISGMLLSEVLKRATYKIPLSKYSLGRSVRKYYF